MNGGPELDENPVPARELTDREAVTAQCPACQAIMPAGLSACGECGKPLSSSISDEAEASSAEEHAVAPATPSPVRRAEDDAHPDAGKLLEDLAGAEEPAPQAAEGPARRAARVRVPRRVVVVAAVAVVLACVGGGVVWSASATGQAPASTARPQPTASARSAASVTLPGWATSPTWTAKGVTDAAASGARVIGVSAQGVTVWEAKTGKTIDTAAMTGQGIRVLAGSVGDAAAVAAVSDAQAVVWIEGQPAPLRLDMSGGRTLETRTGSLVVTGPDRTFWLITTSGEAPLTAPGPQMIVLGATPEAVMWASGSQHLVVASPNGAVLSDVPLAPPAEGATVTPRTGWLQASNRDITVVGWTLQDGGKALGVYKTSTGELLVPTAAADGAAVLSPDRKWLASSGYLISLTSTSVTRFQDGFVPVRWLGDHLYGGLPSGGDAVFSPAGGVSTVPAATARPLAIADGSLISLTGGLLASFTPKK